MRLSTTDRSHFGIHLDRLGASDRALGRDERPKTLESTQGDVDGDRPVFSVIVPTFSRSARLARCLRALDSLEDPPGGYEIIVVDDGSEAQHRSAMEALCRDTGVTLLRQTNAGPATARNAGAAAARGRYLAFVDDDCEPASDWLKALAEGVPLTPDAAFGGRTVNAMTKNRYSAATQALIDYLYSYYSEKGNDTKRGGFFASNNLAVPAERFRALGGFDERYALAAGEDREFCDRWLVHGYPLVYVPDAVVYHTHAMTFTTFCKKHFDYGRGALRFRRDRARRSAGRVRLEPIGFYANLLSWPFRRASRASAPALAALLVLAQLTHAAGFVFEAWSQAARRRGQLRRKRR